MNITRRAFAGGAVSFALSAPFSTRAFAQKPRFATALAAIGEYAEAHRARFDLPGMTIGLTGPDGLSTTLNFGVANRDARTPITPATLFQIGSISKSMTSVLIHQLAGEGKFSLSGRVSDLLPGVPLPSRNAITVQHLLDHVAGLPDDAPLFAEGGLWTAYAPGAHWHYSNTGYDILGKLAEHAGGKPLARLLAERIFAPLGMARSRGAIIDADRALYAQGYEAADQSAVYARGVPLAPAAWVDVTFGAGCVASTADDMTRYLRAIADAAAGRSALGLTPQAAKQFVSHAVSSDTPGMSYGNGLMHVSNEGRSYLHHTGGMVSFSSSFHVDVASGFGAFASSNFSAYAEYRPRLLTRYAVDALTAAAVGKPPPRQPSLEVPLTNAASFTGRFSGPAGSFQVVPSTPLSIVTPDGQSAILQPWGGDLFRTLHPAFRQFTLQFERTKGAITGASWGPNAFVKGGSGAALPKSDPSLAGFTGRFVNDSPWVGVAVVVERGGRLWLGTETPMVKVGPNQWRVGEETWSPERASFADELNGRPQTFVFSGERLRRHDV